ncbi:MAG: radical SAM protein [Nitrospirota bacterium]
MQIILINPHVISSYRLEPNIYFSVLYLGTMLDRNGYEIKIIDGQIENIEDRIEELISDALYVGISVMTSQIESAVKTAKFVRKIAPNKPIIWGGIHPSLYPEQTIQNPYVDYVVVGEGELSILEFTQYLEGKRPISEVKGLLYKENDKIHFNPQRDYFLDLNTLSPPSWHLLQMEKYIHDRIFSGVNFGRYISIHAGRGCNFRCTFCINTIQHLKKWRPLDAENVVNEIKLLTQRYNLTHIKIEDENFFGRKSRVKEFCEKKISARLDISWYCTTRVTYFQKKFLDDELLDLVKRSNFAGVGFGVESGSQRILEMIKKEITVDEVINAVKRCSSVGIIPICSFMIGLPNETQQDMKKTIALIRKISRKPYNALIIGPQIYRPYPGAQLYEEIKDSIKTPETLEEWTKFLGGGIGESAGFISTKLMPWIKNPTFIKGVNFYTGLALQGSPTNIINWMIRTPFKYMAKLRLKFNFFALPIDKFIYLKIKSFYIKLS